MRIVPHTEGVWKINDTKVKQIHGLKEIKEHAEGERRARSLSGQFRNARIVNCFGAQKKLEKNGHPQRETEKETFLF